MLIAYISINNYNGVNQFVNSFLENFVKICKKETIKKPFDQKSKGFLLFNSVFWDQNRSLFWVFGVGLHRFLMDAHEIPDHLKLPLLLLLLRW